MQANSFDIISWLPAQRNWGKRFRHTLPNEQLTRNAHFMISARIFVRELFSLSSHFRHLVERRITNCEAKVIGCRFRGKKFENFGRKNDAFVVVVNDLHFFAQTITFDISFGDSEIGKVGFCSYHRPAETFGRH